MASLPIASPPQYTPSAFNVCTPLAWRRVNGLPGAPYLQPEPVGTVVLRYGSSTAGCWVFMPLAALTCAPLVTLLPPATETERALSCAPPLTDSAAAPVA